MSSHVAQVGVLLVEAGKLPYCPTKFDLLDEAIRLADAHRDPRLGIDTPLPADQLRHAGGRPQVGAETELGRLAEPPAEHLGFPVVGQEAAASRAPASGRAPASASLPASTGPSCRIRTGRRRPRHTGSGSCEILRV